MPARIFAGPVAQIYVGPGHKQNNKEGKGEKRKICPR
jgi:hypothetical protein